jgi:hypothetical protein
VKRILNKEPYSMFNIDMKKVLKKKEKEKKNGKRKETKLGNIKRIIKSL